MDKVIETAVDVNKVVYGYRSNVHVLNEVTLHIPKGQIYALLGPNGCGKTTLIKAILGRIKLNSGSVNVFGVRPGSAQSDIPGPGVGYMPQELALFYELTIKEILTYYSMIYHLKGEEVMNRIENLIEILNLPEKSRPISRLSGGQQRRVSIAVTLIHRPKLIVLDEPTVGVDSLLRHKLWKYLNDICIKYGQTVIITTHYIEEAKSAANVAFMTSGSVLKQSNPQKLLKEYNCQTLEEVFLILCQQNIGRKTIENQKLTENSILDTNDNKIAKKLDISLDIKHIKAMLWKYYILTVRRPLFLVMFYFIPFVALSAMNLSVGQSPYDIPVALYNGDKSPQNLSQLFLNSIDKTYLHLNEYTNNETAFQSVVNGTNYMSIVFKRDFSQTFKTRIKNMLEMSDKDLDNSEVKLYADFSNTALIIYIFKYIFNAFETFSTKVGNTYGYNLYRYMSPISVETPIYGDLDLNVTTHFGPSLLLVLAQCLPLILSALQIIYDRKNTAMERVFVAGVKPIEFFIAHIIQIFLLIISQVFITMIIAFVVFNGRQIGSYFEVYLILVTQGLLGMAIGLMGSLVLSDEVSVAVGLSALMLPLWIASGVLWPLESIPHYFRYISDLSPITLPLEALRSVMLRGWTYTRPTVLLGYAITIGYTLVISLLNLILIQTFSDKALTLNIWNFSYK